MGDLPLQVMVLWLLVAVMAPRGFGLSVGPLIVVVIRLAPPLHSKWK